MHSDCFVTLLQMATVAVAVAVAETSSASNTRTSSTVASRTMWKARRSGQPAAAPQSVTDYSDHQKSDEAPVHDPDSPLTLTTLTSIPTPVDAKCDRDGSRSENETFRRVVSRRIHGPEGFDDHAPFACTPIQPASSVHLDVSPPLPPLSSVDVSSLAHGPSADVPNDIPLSPSSLDWIRAEVDAEPVGMKWESALSHVPYSEFHCFPPISTFPPLPPPRSSTTWMDTDTTVVLFDLFRSDLLT